MFLPYKVDVPMVRWPIANWILIALTCIITIAMFAPLEKWADSQNPGLVLPPKLVQELEAQGITLNDNSYPPIVDSFLLQPKNFHASQLLGNLFIHAGFGHLIGNMIFLFVFGNAVNAKLGHLKFILLYLAIGVIESHFWILLGPGTPCLCASGAIMGIVGAFLILYPHNDVSIGYWIFFVYRGVFQLSAMWVIAFYLALDIYGLVNSHSSGVAYLAHVVGFATGALATAAFLKFKLLEMDRGERSLLQIWKIMPDDGSYDPFARKPIPARTPAVANIPKPRPPLPRKPRDEGPISLD